MHSVAELGTVYFLVRHVVASPAHSRSTFRHGLDLAAALVEWHATERKCIALFARQSVLRLQLRTAVSRRFDSHRSLSVLASLENCVYSFGGIYVRWTNRHSKAAQSLHSAASLTATRAASGKRVVTSKNSC